MVPHKVVGHEDYWSPRRTSNIDLAMNTQANAKASVTRCHHGLQETFDHHHGSDDLGPLGGLEFDGGAPAVTMPAPVADRGVELFDHHWGESGASHQDRQSPNDLLSVIGGSAMAAGDASVVTGFVENFAEDRDDYSIAMGKAIFEASAYSSKPGDAIAAASTFLDVSGTDFIFEHEINQSGHGPHDAWARSELDYLSIDIHGWSPPHGTIVIDVHHPSGQGQPIGQDPFSGNFAQVLALAEAHGADALSATFTNALTIENHFSFVNAERIVAL
jgi:hypothetical protein